MSTFQYGIKKALKKRDELNINEEILEEDKINLSVTDALEEVFQNNKTIERNWPTDSLKQYYWNYLSWIYEEYEGISFERQSLISYKTDDFLPGGNTSAKDGFNSLVNALKIGLDIRYNQIVECVNNYNTSQVEIITNNHKFYGKKVVVTVPLGVLKKKSLKFNPELPHDKITAIDKLGMGLMNKVVLRFPHFFWDSNLYRILHVGQIKGEIPWIDSCSSTDPILLCWMACEYAEEMENFSKEEVLSKIMTILRRIFPNVDVPDPVDYHVTRWGSDPFSYGSWSGILN